MSLDVRLLGPLEVDVAGRHLELRRNKQRALLALLALRPGEVFSRDRIVDELWGERPPKTAVASVQNVISDLRKALSPQVVVTRAPGYALALEPEAVDARRFEAGVDDAGAAARPEERSRLLRSALALWRGEPLAGLELGAFAAAEASRLEELRTAAREALLEAELDLGRHAQVIADLEALVTEHPLRERPTALLMLSLYRAGRQAEALEVYHRARDRLVGELGIEPWPELKRLETAILRHDPTLDAPSRKPPSAPAREEDRRKTVTILFADVVDSTALGASLDPEVLRAVMRRYFDVAQRVIERHGGTVEKFIGDAVMAAFGIPSVHEDDALRAVRAARELRDAIDALNSQESASFLQIRVGVNTGEVLAADPAAQGSYATGAAVNVAVRLEEAAMPGEILLGESTHRLVSYAAGAEAVEGVDLGSALGRVKAFRLLEVGTVPRPLGRAALVGREDELAVLRAAVAGVRAERRSRVLTVVGEAGVGKTRLVSELIDSLGSDERALVGRCASYGEGATYLPLADLVAQALPTRRPERLAALLGSDEQAVLVAQRVTQLTGEAEGSASTGEIFWAVRRFLEALAGEGPVVVVLDDVHWAEPTLLDLVEYLSAWPADAPLLVVSLTRPELLDDRPGWGAGGQTLRVEPLRPDAASEVLEELAAPELTPRDRTRIVETAEGNPLFLEQLLAFAGEVGVDALTRVPPSVEAILAARIERLEPEERGLLERAAVAGRECSWQALVQLTPPDELPGVDGRLMDLVRRGLLVAARTQGEDAFRFHHGLVRDVAYAGMTKEARIRVHERYGSWLDQRTDAAEEVVGYHLEQAFHYRRTLGLVDRDGLENARRAATLLASAGRRAPARGDWPAAVALFSRAAALLPDDSPERLALLPELGRAYGRCGDYGRELDLLDEAIERAAAVGDRRTRSYATLFRGHARLHVDPEFGVEDELADVEESLRTFEELGDRRGEARAWARLAYYNWFRGRNAEARAAEERALAYAVSVGDEALEAEAHGFIGSTLLNGPAPLDELFAYAEGLEEPGRKLRETRVRPLLGLLGVAHAMRGDFDTGRELVAEEVAAYEEVGNQHAAVRAAADGLAPVELLAGDAAAAEEHWRRGLLALQEIGETGHLSTLAALLAGALCTLGRYDEAEEYSRWSERAAGRDDYLSQVLWRSARARAYAGQDRIPAATDLARAAVALAEKTDDLNTTGEAYMALAAVLQRARRSEEASAAAGEALLLYERKGNLVSAAEARTFVAQRSGTPAL
jgi:DNA-binding SARP family transcriptional activator